MRSEWIDPGELAVNIVAPCVCKPDKDIHARKQTEFHLVSYIHQHSHNGSWFEVHFNAEWLAQQYWIYSAHIVAFLLIAHVQGDTRHTQKYIPLL